MKRRISDIELEKLVKKALYSFEDPAAGFVFDDFDRRYAEKEWKRELDSARWFYRDKTPFETKYDEDCISNDGDEPAWVSDHGNGAKVLTTLVTYDLDGDQQDPLWLRLWRQKRLQLRPKHRAILDALAIDWRTSCAARIAGASRPTVDLCKKIFKVHFAQCYQAWKRDFAF